MIIELNDLFDLYKMKLLVIFFVKDLYEHDQSYFHNWSGWCYIEG